MAERGWTQSSGDSSGRGSTVPVTTYTTRLADEFIINGNAHHTPAHTPDTPAWSRPPAPAQNTQVAYDGANHLTQSLLSTAC